MDLAQQTTIAVGMFVMCEEEEAAAIICDIREHRFWTKKWTQERDERDVCNTMYKLQCELLQVGVTMDLSETCRCVIALKTSYVSICEKKSFFHASPRCYCVKNTSLPGPQKSR